MTGPNGGGDSLWYDYETEEPPPAKPPGRRLRRVALLAVMAAGVGAVLASLFDLAR